MADLRRAFVTGLPVKHSRSPLIHNYWLKKYNLQGSYQAVENTTDGFPQFLTNLHENGFVGGNITLPFKEVAFQKFDQSAYQLDEAARSIGAVNTVWLDDKLKLQGGNTDAYGFSANLDAIAPDWDKKKNALVLGAGGASRAVIFALLQRGFTKINLVNRTVERAQALATHFGSMVTASSWDVADSLVAEAGLIVNTTSLGMSSDGVEERFPLNLQLADSSAIATDIVYIPLETAFLKQAKNAGLVTVDGVGMLLHQAVPGFEHWFKIRPEVTSELRQLIIDDMKNS